jgi:hypothetical protein
MHYPATGVGASFAWGLIKLFFSTSLAGNAQGVLMLLQNLAPSKPAAAAKQPVGEGSGSGKTSRSNSRSRKGAKSQ